MIKEGTASRPDHYRYFYEVMVISVKVVFSYHLFYSMSTFYTTATSEFVHTTLWIADDEGTK
jgi:hypothetical protein